MSIDDFNARVNRILEQVDRPPATAVTCLEDAPDKRIKIYFRDAPDEATKSMLRHHGFMWRGGTTGAWCRKLDKNGRRAAQNVMEKLNL